MLYSSKKQVTKQGSNTGSAYVDREWLKRYLNHNTQAEICGLARPLQEDISVGWTVYKKGTSICMKKLEETYRTEYLRCHLEDTGSCDWFSKIN